MNLAFEIVYQQMYILVFQYYAVYSQNGDNLPQTFVASTYLVTLHYLAVQRF